MNTSLVASVSKEEKEKQNLQKSLTQKQKTLTDWMEKVESLRIELDLIKNEYDVRVGALLLKDNQLDLEIIQYKNLKRLMDEGMTYAEAVRREEDKFYNEILNMQKEQERIRKEEEMLEARQEVSGEIQESIKVLWKKLIRKFHPDLTIDAKEKTRREDLMKQINNAYAANDFDTLLQIEQLEQGKDIGDVSLARLQQILVETENMILAWKEKFLELRSSEWYLWKKKKEKQKITEDIFAHVERGLLDDIVKKIEILQKLRREVGDVLH